ncbi:unnamed protein product [Rotaria sordida]|uniref:Fibronectin type-III domain-containing protein n=1 Tax=Rotaria sordida TaxID=392033 RepID=A0A818S592_9BILA|nr:unnamed protein product [Rotaria sordida]
MSAGILPDMYRYTARKSTVSKNPKPSNVSLCNNSTTHYSTYHNDNNTKQQQIFDTIEHNIKLEKDVPQQQESFMILPDNEIEQMIIEENNEKTQEEIIYDIVEGITNQTIQTPIISNLNQITKTFLIDTQDVHDVIDSIMNHIIENDNEEFLSTKIDNKIEENVNNNVQEITPMESDQPISIISRSQIDDDLVEFQETSNNDDSPTCTCQCHKSNSPLNNEYFLFEQALKQARLEQQQESSLTNNRLIQTLKRQHEELINIYQQNKIQKQVNLTKIDREQQTIKLHQHDSQVQTDLTTINNSKISPKQQKSIIIPTMNSHTTNNNGILTATRNYNTVYNSIQTSSSSSSSTSSLQQIIPRLSANALATTTITNKTSTVTTKSAIVTNSQSTNSLPPPPPPPPSQPPPPALLSTATSHDVVDLTEEDEDDNTNRTPTAQRITSTRQSTTFIQPATSTTTLTPIATTTATRIRPTNRTIRPNPTVPNGQAFPLRPLPEHNPCDHTIARPQLNITQENATVRLTWNLQSTPMESIQNYEIYAYKQNATVTASDWKKIGTVKSMRLPMAVTLKEFQSNSHYAFAVRAVSINNNIGPFCEPKTIFTGNTPVQPLHTSQLLNVST